MVFLLFAVREMMWRGGRSQSCRSTLHFQQEAANLNLNKKKLHWRSLSSTVQSDIGQYGCMWRRLPVLQDTEPGRESVSTPSTVLQSHLHFMLVIHSDSCTCLFQHVCKEMSVAAGWKLDVSLHELFSSPDQDVQSQWKTCDLYCLFTAHIMTRTHCKPCLVLKSLKP